MKSLFVPLFFLFLYSEKAAAQSCGRKIYDSLCSKMTEAGPDDLIPILMKLNNAVYKQDTVPIPNCDPNAKSCLSVISEITSLDTAGTKAIFANYEIYSHKAPIMRVTEPRNYAGESWLGTRYEIRLKKIDIIAISNDTLVSELESLGEASTRIHSNKKLVLIQKPGRENRRFNQNLLGKRPGRK